MLSTGLNIVLLHPYINVESISYSTLKHQGMPQQQLTAVTYSIIVLRILYALPAWGGFISAELINRINAFLSASSGLVI